uniref:Keratinocyte differentiation associated protein n=1 Tax=Moschus moschiferus TaxID=68415 RepID=A0A8C6CWZ7_MOSMO
VGASQEHPESTAEPHKLVFLGRSPLFSTLSSCCLQGNAGLGSELSVSHTPPSSPFLVTCTSVYRPPPYWDGEETTIGNYAAGPEAFNAQFLNIDKLRSALRNDEFLNWHALFESIKRKLPFLNWDAFPKLKGLRSATPDAQ